MSKKIILLVLALALSALPVSFGQADSPTIAILRFGEGLGALTVAGAVLDVLESYGFISAEENAQAQGGKDLEGDNLNVYFGGAGFDFAAVNVIVDDALDRNPDVLIVTSVPVAQVVAAATMDMDDPPALLFTMVNAPFEAGIAESTCIKPDHITGGELVLDYGFVLSTLLLQDPELSRVGVIYASSMVSGHHAVAQLKAAAAELDLEVLEAGVASLSDIPAAADGLVERGAQAFIASGDAITTSGLSIVTATASEVGLPVFHPSLASVTLGATIGAGFSGNYLAGNSLGVLLANYLNGELDIARTRIYFESANLIGVNVDLAEAQGVELSQAVLDEASLVYGEDGIKSLAPQLLQLYRNRGKIVPLEQRQAADAEFIASLHCTDEMIAEQQAALEL